MQKTSTALMLASALGATAMMSVPAKAAPASAPSYQYEKCYGIAAAGKNDCAATGSHSCAAESKRADDPKSWIFVPVGTCAKISGGSLTAKM